MIGQKKIDDINGKLKRMGIPKAYRALVGPDTIRMQELEWVRSEKYVGGGTGKWKLVNTIASGGPRECIEAMSQHFNQLQADHQKKESP